MPFPPAELSAFVSRVVAACLDMRSVWMMGYAMARPVHPHELLAFADAATLRRLRGCNDLHHAGVAMLVVVDGDAFESAWGLQAAGSLARRSWRQVSPQLAYYDESSWGPGGDVVRVRREATLLWQSAAPNGLRRRAR